LGKSPGQKWQGKIRVVIQYVFSKTKMLTGYINMWSEQIENEEGEIKELKAILKHMESPFGFIEGFTMNKNGPSRGENEDDDGKKKTTPNYELPPEIAARLEKMEVHEKALEARVDIVANTFA
jgi:hypothetical protein